MAEPADVRYQRLQDILSRWDRAAVAFSGGVDSLLLLHAAADTLGKANVTAYIGTSPTLPSSELEMARKLAEDLHVDLVEVETGVMEDQEFTTNPQDRCYHCRLDLTRTIREAVSEGKEGIVVMDGANVDDLTDYRPGLKAASELGVVHPLVMAGITKQDVRDILEYLGYPESIYTLPASPCLSSRIPYGETITPDSLQRIEMAEELLKEKGFRLLRVRHYGLSTGPMACIELDEEGMNRMDDAMRREIVTALRSLGFTRVVLNLEGFRSGNLNDALRSPDGEIGANDHEYGSSDESLSGKNDPLKKDMGAKEP